MTASDVCESCPATYVLPPDASPAPQQARVSPRDDPFVLTDCASQSPVLVGQGRVPLRAISQEQLRRVLAESLSGCFELTQESQPLYYSTPKQSLLIRKDLEITLKGSQNCFP